MYKMYLSVIIPVYNVEQYLSRCLNSLLAQTFDEFEILLINDGSTDSSREICDNYIAKDARIKVFHQKNSGVSSARNFGLKQAQGGWIYFMDADDWLEPNAFSAFKKILSIHPQIDIYKFGFYKDLANRSISVCDKEQKIVKNSMDMFLATEKNHYHAFVWNMIFRKQLADSLWFNEDIHWCEDHIFTLTLYTKAKYMFIDNNMYYHYIIHERGTSLSYAYHNPYMIRNATRLEAEAKKACLIGDHPEILSHINHTYNALMKNAIRCLYKGIYSYQQRKEFFQSIDKPFNHLINIKYQIKYNLYNYFRSLFRKSPK